MRVDLFTASSRVQGDIRCYFLAGDICSGKYKRHDIEVDVQDVWSRTITRATTGKRT